MNNMNNTELKEELLQLKTQITMPGKLADELTKACREGSENHQKSSPNRRAVRQSGHYRRLVSAAAAALLCLCAVGSTSFAYNTYQEKQLAVFMEPDLTQAEIEALGSKIAKIDDISSSQYISGNEAWAEFKAAYFSDSPEAEALAADFTENPLADSFNYRVSVRLGADTQAVRIQIGKLPGVRKITTVREARQEMQDGN